MTDQTSPTSDDSDSQKILNEFLSLLDQGITIYTVFVKGEDDVMTHEVLVIRCGDTYVQSQPVPLSTPVIEAPSQSSSAYLN